MLVVAPKVVTFAPLVLGAVETQTVTITNETDTAVTLTAVTPPAPPFSVSDLPAVGTVLASGDSFVVTLAYTPTVVGSSSGYLSVAAGDAVAAVAVEGSALKGGTLRITPAALDAGSLAIGSVATSVFRLTNDGDAALVIEKSKPPTSAAFQAQSPFGEGTILAPGASLTQLVRVSPTMEGTNADVWQLNANDGLGLRLVTMTAFGLPRLVVESTAAASGSSPTPTVTAAEAAASSTASPLTSAEPRSSGGGVVTSNVGCDVGGGAPGAAAPLGLMLAAVVLARRSRRRA